MPHPSLFHRRNIRDRFSSLLLLSLLIQFGLAPWARAQFTQSNYWRMGENDSSDTPGSVATSSKDPFGNLTLSFENSPTYEGVTNSTATTATGSASCLHFPLGSYGTGTVNSTLVDNFCIELWVNPDRVTSGNQCLAYNGNPGQNGWGIYIIGGNYGALFGDVAYIPTGYTAVTNQWVYLALVRNNGTNIFYVNGYVFASTTATPNAATGSFGVAASPASPTTDNFAGYLDEVRIFTFAANESPQDYLLVGASRPAVTTGAASSIGTSTATLGGTVSPDNLDSGGFFQYGTSTNYGSTTASTLATDGYVDLPISIGISGLLAGQQYHFRAVATNSAGTVYGADNSFAAEGAPPFFFLVSTADLTADSVTFRAFLGPGGLATTNYFEYGFDTSYGYDTATDDIAAGNTAVLASNSVTGLFPGWTYHYAAVAVNSAGTTTTSDNTFTVPGTGSAITVTTTADDGSAGSLREAINDIDEGGTITITATGTITLTNSLPVVFRNVNINGPGVSSLTVSGDNQYRIFFVDAGSNGIVNISGMTLANGLAAGGDGGGGAPTGGGGMGAGGALFVNSGAVGLSNVNFSGNAAVGGNGGAVCNGCSDAGGGGGGLGGGGGSSTGSGGGGGGFAGAGGSPDDFDGGGGGGFYGNGGAGYEFAGGGGGGAFANGRDGITGGAGGAGGGGNGGTGSFDGPSPGGNGQTYGGGGGAGYFEGNGGNAGEYGGGGGGAGTGSGGNGGDFGGGGGTDSGSGGAGGFGGGGGGGPGNSGGNGGFGGGGGGSGRSGFQVGGGFDGGGGGGGSGSGGGGGAALGGAIFVRANNDGASISLTNTTFDAGSVTGGAALDPNNGSPAAQNGGSSGSSIFMLTGTNILTVSSSTTTNTIAGSIADASPVGFSPTPLEKNGPGTLILSSSNSYTGSTFVNAGALLINGDNTSSTNLYVENSGTLGGSGTAGLVTVENGGTLSPGDNIFTANSLIAAGNWTFDLQIYNGGTGELGVGYSPINVNGALNLGSYLVTLALSSPNGQPPGLQSLEGSFWNIIFASGGITGYSPANWTITTSGLTTGLSNYSFVISAPDGNGLYLTLVTQPFLSAQPVSYITSSSAVLSAQVNPYNLDSTIYFLSGTTTNYGTTNSMDIGANNNDYEYSTLIAGLSPETLYHYQILASNMDGTAASGDQTFTTSDDPPIATTGAGSVSATAATLFGSINPDGSFLGWYFHYGLTTNYGSSTATNALDYFSFDPSAISINSAISGLSPGTTYHFIAAQTNYLGTTFGTDMTFTTLAAAPAVTVESPTGITNSGATLNGQVTPNGASTTVYFAWGKTTSYGTTNIFGSAGSGDTAVPVSDTLSSLAADTLYHYKIIASNSVSTTASSDQTFTTLAGPPVVVMIGSSSITATGAALLATVNPEGEACGWFFEYGVTTNYGLFTPTNLLASGGSPVSVSNAVAGLAPLTTYHFQAFATNGLGRTGGGDQTFMTGANPPVAITGSASNITASGATLTATVTPNVGSGSNAMAWFEYGLTTAYANTTATNTVPSGPALPISNAVTGLQPGTEYHFRVDAIGESAVKVTGSDGSFVTLDIPRAINNVSLPTAGQLSLQFTGGPGIDYTVLTATNVATPLSNWIPLGSAILTNSTNDLFQFTDTNATNNQQYYMLQHH